VSYGVAGVFTVITVISACFNLVKKSPAD
jgi:hypothetical protein